MDFKTDAQLRTALKQEITNSVVIIVAQRISTILDADQIIVKQGGIGMNEEKEILETPSRADFLGGEMSADHAQDTSKIANSPLD